MNPGQARVTIALPQKQTDEGAETRLLLAECLGPSIAGYNLANAKSCMQLMDRVLWNRVNNPRPFLAKSPTLIAVITAPGQFQGFQHYPNYDHGIVHNIQSMIDIANNPRDHRGPAFASFIQTAIQVAADASIPDPSPGHLTSWRTAGAGSPGPDFTAFKTILNTTFYYTK